MGDERADSKDTDQIYITKLMMVKYFVGTCQIIVIIMSISYFLGVIWFMFCFEIWDHWESRTELDSEVYNIQTFITEYNVEPDSDQRTHSHDMALLMYFAYTTLSTVGFGDFHPKSDWERLFGIVILLLGVAIFGLILGNF